MRMASEPNTASLCCKRSSLRLIAHESAMGQSEEKAKVNAVALSRDKAVLNNLKPQNPCGWWCQHPGATEQRAQAPQEKCLAMADVTHNQFVRVGPPNLLPGTHTATRTLLIHNVGRWQGLAHWQVT